MNDDEPDVTVVPVRISDGAFPPRRPFAPPENRWAAFTTNELRSILRHIMYAPNALPGQIEAELERRNPQT